MLNRGHPIRVTKEQAIARIVLGHYPAVQGIYLFGTHGTEYGRSDSDVDIALLLPPEQAKKEGDLAHRWLTPS